MGHGAHRQIEFLVVARDHDLHHCRQFKAHQGAYTRAGIDSEPDLIWLVHACWGLLLGADPLYWREELENRRVAAFFAVLMLHAIVGMILMRSSASLLSAVRRAPAEFLITYLRPAEPREPEKPAPATKPIADEIAPGKPPSTPREVPKAEVAPDRLPDAQGEITLLPPIDWTHEAELAVRSSMDTAEREKLYRNLAGLSAAQLDWIQKNHMEPVDTNPPWAETAPRNNADGVLWISDNCALVNLLPFCEFKIGHKKPRGDLFKNMREYLDKRETDPLP
jgi:hypothetical protein